MQDSDQIFNSWADLLGETNEEGEDVEQANTSSHKPDVKEACNLM